MNRDDQKFAKFVSEDIEFGWAALKKEVEARETGEPSVGDLLEFTELLDLEGDEGDQARVNEIFARVPAGQIWAEFYAEPYLGIEVVDGEELVVLKATNVGVMTSPDLGSDVERVWVSKLDPANHPAEIDKYFYLRMACPRCFYSAKVDSGEDYIEWDDYRDETDPDCWACEGTGEWELGS
jgi:hypothetical protein